MHLLGTFEELSTRMHGKEKLHNIYCCICFNVLMSDIRFCLWVCHLIVV